MAISVMSPQTEQNIILDIAYAIRETIRRLESRGEISLLWDMTKQAELTKEIYGIYNTDKEMAVWLRNIVDTEGQARYVEEVRKKNIEFVQKLELARNLVAQYGRRNQLLHLDEYWIRVYPVSPPGIAQFNTQVTKRLYLNCKPEYINYVIAKLAWHLAYCTRCETQLPIGALACPSCGEDRIRFMFKFPHPHLAIELEKVKDLIRADKLVIYYASDNKTHIFLSELVKQLSKAKYFGTDTPLFTYKIVDGVGFAYEPPISAHEYSEKHTGELASFGTFMALVIARYLQAWMAEDRKCHICRERLPRGANACPHCGADIGILDTRDIPNAQQIVEIAKQIFNFKLKQQHNFPFEP